MKNIAILFLVTFLVTFYSCKKEEDTQITIQETPKLTEQEEMDLLFSCEQEKLLRDVYLYSFDKYGNAIFNQIAGSQNVRMSELKGLISSYNLDDPTSLDIGMFSTSSFQDIYNTALIQSDSSLESAIMAILYLEDKDMVDIREFISNTTKENMLYTYEFMYCTSENHIRWLYPELLLEGGTYTPQFISQDDFNEIINSNLYQCR